MPVVRHEAIAEELHRDDAFDVGEDIEEGLAVGGLVEEALAIVAAVQDVIDDAAGRDASNARHGGG